MKPKSVNFQADRNELEILNRIKSRKRSDFIRNAIVFYYQYVKDDKNLVNIFLNQEKIREENEKKVINSENNTSNPLSETEKS